jgi:hypothetical protein
MSSIEEIKDKIMEKGDNCPLCNKVIQLDKLVLISKCGHLFHINCVLKDEKNCIRYMNKFKCELCFD